MNHDQICGMLDREVRNIVQQMLCNNQISVQQHNYVLNEWNMNRNHLTQLAFNKYGSYGGPNLQQANAIAMNFINTGMMNFQRNGGRPSSMVPNQPMYGGTPMMSGYGGGFGSPDPYGGMYGGGANQYSGNAYTSPQYNPGNPPVTDCPYSAALESDSPTVHANPQNQAPSTVAVAAQPVAPAASTTPSLFVEDPETAKIFSVEMISLEPDQFGDENSTETMQIAKTTDAGEVNIIHRSTENVYGTDQEAIATENWHNKKSRNAEIRTLTYNRSAMYAIPRNSFIEFQKFLESNFDRDACFNTKDYRGMMKGIIKEIRTNIENVSMKVGTMLENLIVKLINDRAYTGNFAGSGDDYQRVIKNLDDLVTMDSPDRGLKVLLLVIDEIKRYNVLDIADSEDRALIEDMVPEKYNIDALQDLTDEDVIKNTIEEINNDLTFVIFKRVIYQFSRIHVPLVIKGGAIYPTVSPTFKGTPDTTFEHFLNILFDRDFLNYNPIRMYIQPTPNLIIAFVIAQTIDGAIRLCPAGI